ncbi:MULTISPECIES: hypothetical protein [unclassified Streptomyces]|uniref:hypothetical protein n=1 Tax=unclassified Streptomyces TaxID=2593676 RepID=UPI003D8E0BF8
MSRIHYRGFAAALRRALREHPEAQDAIKELADEMALIFVMDNRRFDRTRFFDAVFQEESP